MASVAFGNGFPRGSVAARHAASTPTLPVGVAGVAGGGVAVAAAVGGAGGRGGKSEGGGGGAADRPGGGPAGGRVRFLPPGPGRARGERVRPEGVRGKGPRDASGGPRREG